MNRLILWSLRFVEFRELERIVIKTWGKRMNGDTNYRWHWIRRQNDE